MKKLNFNFLLFLSFLSVSVLTSSCSKEEVLPAYEIVNNDLQGTWQLFEFIINEEDYSDSINSEDITTFKKSEDDARKGTLEVLSDGDVYTDPYTLSEDGKTIVFGEGEDEGESSILIEADVLTLTTIDTDLEGVENVYVQKSRRK